MYESMWMLLMCSSKVHMLRNSGVVLWNSFTLNPIFLPRG